MSSRMYLLITPILDLDGLIRRQVGWSWNAGLWSFKVTNASFSASFSIRSSSLRCSAILADCTFNFSTKWRHDSDKQTGMADDCFLQTRKTSSFQTYDFETKTLLTFTLFLSEHAYVVWTSSDSIFRLRALRYKRFILVNNKAGVIQYSATQLIILFSLTFTIYFWKVFQIIFSVCENWAWRHVLISVFLSLFCFQFVLFCKEQLQFQPKPHVRRRETLRMVSFLNKK